MVSNNLDHHHHQSLQIKQDDKFFSRLMSKETSIFSSFRGTSGSVPFMWESQPGTPKKHFHRNDNTLPVLLTPPPSYYSKSTANYHKPPTTSRSNFFAFLFTSRKLKNSSAEPEYSSSNMLHYKRRFSSSVSSFDYEHNQSDDGFGSPRSNMCFGGIRRIGGRCYKW